MVAEVIMEKTSTRVIVDILRKLGGGHLDNSQTRSMHNALLDELQKVSVVDLSRRKIGDKGITALGKALQDCPVPRLERLSLEANDIGFDGMAAIGGAIGCGNLTSLKILHLSLNDIGEQGCRKLADGFLGNRTQKATAAIALKNNFSFEIWNKKSKSKSRNLRNSGSLRDPTADSQDFSDDTIGMKSFKTAPNLHTLWLSGNNIGDAGTKALAEAFESGHCPALRVLRLFKNEIKAEGAQALAKALKAGGLLHLEALNLGQNPIGGEGTKALVTAIEAHKVTGLKEIGLSFIPSMTTEACVLLAGAMKGGHLPALEALYLHKNAVGNDGAIALWKALASGHGRKLKVLDLEGNHIVSEGMEELARVLRSDLVPNLEILDLVENSIGSEGGRILGEAFQNRNNKNLKWLALAGNSIGDEGCISLSRALEQDHISGLQRLDLASNRISLKGISALANALEKGKVVDLIHLSLDGNALDHRSVIALVGALRNNPLPNLKSLSLKNNKAGDQEKAAEAVIAAYVRNPLLKTEIRYDWPDDVYAARVKQVMQERNKSESLKVNCNLKEQARSTSPMQEPGCWACAPMLLVTFTKKKSGRKFKGVAEDAGLVTPTLTPTGSFRDVKGSKFCDVPPLERPTS